jgi:alkylation response protein AidB-like acyl-CoA dehydrogenase
MLDFSISKEQKLVKDEFSKLVKELVFDQAHEIDETGDIPAELIQQIWEMGASISSVPENYGGFGAKDSPVETALILEELAYGDMAVAVAATLPSLFIQALLLSGDQSQKDKYLPILCSESYPACTVALNEPHFQFDAARMRTSAVKKDNLYLLSGKKCFVPMAENAEHFLVAAALEGRNQLFIVPKGALGMTIGEQEKNIGLNGLKMYEIELDNCQIDESQRLGGNDGSDYETFLQRTRIGLSAIATGIGRASYEFVRKYAKDRSQFGEPIAHRQAVAFMIAEMAYEVDAMRLMTWKAASKFEAGKPAGRESYLAKLYAGDKSMKICDYGVQVMGGHGYIREYPVERYYRNSRGISILEGLAIA